MGCKDRDNSMPHYLWNKWGHKNAWSPNARSTRNWKIKNIYRILTARWWYGLSEFLVQKVDKAVNKESGRFSIIQIVPDSVKVDIFVVWNGKDNQLTKREYFW